MVFKIFTLLLVVVIVSEITSSNVWETPENVQNAVAKDNILIDNYCKENDCRFKTQPMPNEFTKRNHKHFDLENIPTDDTKFSFFPAFYQHQLIRQCSCRHEKRLVDLGPNYFPRYISDMVCIAGSCGPNYACKSKNYKLWVMRKRHEDDEPGTEPIPKELRDFWIAESVTTTIDCECALI